MAKKEFSLLSEYLYWSYANLAMAHSAVDKNAEKYIQINYIIRARLFKGLMQQTMNIQTFPGTCECHKTIIQH